MAEYIGSLFLAFGGMCALAITLGVIVWIAASIWISASNKWRNILKAESLIYEYRKNRKDYLFWREQIRKDGADNG